MHENRIRVHRSEMRPIRWWIPVITGLLVSASGVGLLLWPFIAAASVLVAVVGAALIANGLAVLIRGGRGTSGVAGVLLILIGVLALLFTEFTARALVAFVGGTLLAIGIVWLLGMLRLAGGSTPLLLLPILCIGAGAVALLWPAFSLTVIAVLGGLLSLALGGSLVALGIRLRRSDGSGESARRTTIVID